MFPKPSSIYECVFDNSFIFGWVLSVVYIGNEIVKSPTNSRGIRYNPLDSGAERLSHLRAARLIDQSDRILKDAFQAVVEGFTDVTIFVCTGYPCST
jgi:hypothetical protein